MKFLCDLENYLRQQFPNYPAENVLSLEACPAGQQTHRIIHRIMIPSHVN